MRDGKVVDVRGDEMAHNEGVICVKGSMNRALPFIKGRLLKPKIRKDGKLVDASWDEALDLAAEQFKKIIATSGPDAVAFYGSGQLFTEETYTANKLFKAGIRTNNVDGNPRLCMASAASGYVRVYGKDEPPGCYADIDHADCFFIFGGNPFECHPPIFERIQRRRRLKPDVQIIVVDPRRTATAERATIHLTPFPGTDLLLLNAMAQVICEEEWLDPKFVLFSVRFKTHDGEVTDFESFRKFLEAYRPERVEAELGISADDIRMVAHKFAKSPATMSLWTMGANQRTQGTAINTMLNALHLLTGQICREGATPFSLTGQPNACGGVRDTGALAHLLPNGRSVANEKHRQEVEKLWKLPAGTISLNPGLDASSLFSAMGSGKIEAALIMCTNPAQSMPALDRYRKGMKKTFLVVADIFEDSETARLADVLFPAALWVEKEGVLGQGERRYQLVEKLLDPPGECRSDLRILCDFAERLGYGKLISARTPNEVWDEWRKFSAASAYNFKGMTYARLRKERGLQWPCPDENHPGTPRRYVEGVDPFVKAGTGIEFYGQPDGRAVIYLEPYKKTSESPTPEYPFVLTTGRVLEQWHTGTMTNRIKELKQSSGPAVIEMSRHDAERLMIVNGDRVALQSRYGLLEGQVRVTSSLKRGVLFASFYDAKLMINRIVADHVDPISKQPEYKVTAVKLWKVSV